ncbi:FAD-dependent 2-octaprenylphenol hydroxylase [Alteromonadaceae bacterium M269]|nr:FAD-dependent 2-octaprenylphenol hydroxylase [Alteromonadaceae bacterium M269]
MQSFDLVISGAGMVGLTLALALKSSGLTVAIVDPKAEIYELSDEPELRVSAINVASQKVFESLDVWPLVLASRAQAYTHMHVWDKDSFASIDFDHQQVNQDNLGHIVENAVITNSLLAVAKQSEHITFLTPDSVVKVDVNDHGCFIQTQNGEILSARLLVGADGGQSKVRQQANMPQTFWDYEQTAIVATVKTALPHQQCARQVFTEAGPLALLPLWDEHLCSIVWSQDTVKAADLLSLDGVQFGRALTAAFDNKLGVTEVVSQRQSFPLTMRYTRQWLKPRQIVLGDAAHTIHPLAGQGANLGILEAGALAKKLIALTEQQLDIGEVKNLRSFERESKNEAVKMIATMEGFKRLFHGENPLLKLVRGVGLTAVNQLPALKQKIIMQAMGVS